MIEAGCIFLVKSGLVLIQNQEDTRALVHVLGGVYAQDDSIFVSVLFLSLSVFLHAQTVLDLRDG
jgi:hypothetical protein